jgi:DNA-binding LytR/AlgR family response regulator
MAEGAQGNPEGWVDRLSGRDGGRPAVTSGAGGGTNGAWRAVRAWLAVTAVIAANVFVNVMTRVDDARPRNPPAAFWRAIVDEGTSAVAALAVMIVIPLALKLAPPGRGPLWRTIAVHVGGSLAYSIGHVALMTLLRALIAAALHQPFSWHWSEAPYEYRKDALSYLGLAGIFWLLDRPKTAPAQTPASPAAASPGAPVTFDIRDGATLRRVPVGEILAAKAAGNYVEFALRDGARPLMRASMAQIETALTPHGFVRTHRSWLVNAERVRAMSAAGSGDFRLDLEGGVTAPMSRRYPAARARLAGDG